jgi:hypothetical protein
VVSEKHGSVGLALLAASQSVDEIRKSASRRVELIPVQGAGKIRA